MLRGRPASEPKTARTTKKTDEAAAPQTPGAEAPAPAPVDSDRVPLAEVMPKPAKKGGRGQKKDKSHSGAKPAAKAATGAKRPAKEAPTKTAKEPKKASGLDLAAQVLADSKEPLAVKAITDRAVAAGWKSNGATPAATLAAAIGREIKDKGKASRFKKTGRGLFAFNRNAEAKG